MSILNKSYSANTSYPDSITKGWHNVVVTDNINFCKDAKVFVSGNRIKEFVIDNYIRLNFSAIGTIKKGKNVVTLQKYNGEQLKVVDATFLYDIEEPVIVEPPLDPSCLCLWVSNRKHQDWKVRINGSVLAGFISNFEKSPRCFEDGTICILLKSGVYNFTTKKSGKDVESSVEIKGGKCLKYRLD